MDTLISNVTVVTMNERMDVLFGAYIGIRDGKISSELIMKQSYRDRLEGLAASMDTESTQEEFSILDRAGRIQIPRDMLSRLQLEGNKVRVEYRDGGVFISAPDAEN